VVARGGGENGVRIKAVSVSCEGYLHSKDPYKLEKSCGLRLKADFEERILPRRRAAAPPQAIRLHRRPLPRRRRNGILATALWHRASHKKAPIHGRF
jgi:hypothetical protein